MGLKHLSFFAFFLAIGIAAGTFLSPTLRPYFVPEKPVQKVVARPRGLVVSAPVALEPAAPKPAVVMPEMKSELRSELKPIYPPAGEIVRAGGEAVDVRFFWQTNLKPPFVVEVADDAGFSVPTFSKSVASLHEALRFEKPKDARGLNLFWRVIHVESQLKSEAQQFQVNWLEAPRFSNDFEQAPGQKTLLLSWDGPYYDRYRLKFTVEGRERTYDLSGRKFDWLVPELAPGEKPKSVIVSIYGVTADKKVSPGSSAVVALKSQTLPKLSFERRPPELRVQFAKDGRIECTHPLRLSLSPTMSSGRAELVEQAESGEFFVRPVAAATTNFCPNYLGQVKLFYRVQVEGQPYWVESEKALMRVVAAVPDLRVNLSDNGQQLLFSGEQKHLGVEVEIKNPHQDVRRERTESGRVNVTSISQETQVRARYLASMNAPVSGWTAWMPALGPHNRKAEICTTPQTLSASGTLTKPAGQ